VTTPESELEMFIEFCRQAGHYPVTDIYEKSWLPFKAKMLADIEEAKSDV
jgi:hypothetical protein